MGVTRLKRKEKRNRAKANNRVARVKQLMVRPIIKNVDVEAIKQEFAAKAKPAAKAEKTPKAEQETPAEKTPKAETAQSEKKSAETQPAEAKSSEE